MGEIKFIAGILLTIVFTIAIISYVINFANDNNAPVSLASDPEFSSLSSDLKGDVQTFREQTNSSSQAFSESSIEAGSDTLQSPGVFLTIISLPKMIYSILSLGFSQVFGNDVAFGVVFTALATFISIVAILYIWKTWKGGNPD